MPNEEYLDLTGLARFLDKIREKELKNRARNYVINPSQTLTSEYLNSSFNNADDMSIALRKSYNGTDFKLKDVDGNDILIKDLKLGDQVSIKQISEYYPERFVGLIDTNFVHFYAYTCLAFNHIVQGSMKPVTSGAVYDALLPFNKVSTTTTTTANVVDVPSSAKGLATLKQIGGMSWKVNQILAENQIHSSGTNFTTSGHTITFSGTNTSGSTVYNFFTGTISIEVTHKYYFCGGVYQLTLADGSGNHYEYNSTIKTGFSSYRCYKELANGRTFNNEIVTPQLFDLTAMGIDTTDVDVAKAELLKRGIDVNTYNEYNAGSIHDSAVTKVESVGVNLWDEESVAGQLNALGEQVQSATDIVSKNFIKVKPNTTYYAKCPTTTYFTISLYNANQTQCSANTYKQNDTFTTPSDCNYIKLCTNGNYGTTYNHDICINKSNSAINGNYYPYVKYELPIPSAIRSITGYGWGVNENCYNYIDFTLNEFRQYVGRVDLGTLTYGGSDGDSFCTTVNYIKNNSTQGLCSMYACYGNYADYANASGNRIGFSADGTMYISNSSYTDPTAFKTAMSGVYLYYELATPVITDISSLLDEVHIPIEANGTLELVNTYNNAVPVQVTFDNGLVDVVLTNHEHDIEQQKEIDFLLRGGNLKTINEQSLVGSGNISISADISHRYCIGLYDSNYTPIFIAFLTDAEQESYDTEPSKASAISWIKAFWGKEQGNDIWFTTDVTNDAGYYEAGTGIVQAYEGLIGVVYDESQGSGNETITAYFADGTTQQIALNDIGDTSQDNYFFRVF